MLAGILLSSALFIGARTPLALDAERDDVVRTNCDTLVVAREVVNAKPVVRAVWNTTALGVYEAYVNGVAMENQVLKPGYTNTRRRRLSCDWDVTARMRKGDGERNVFAARVTSGWWRDQVVGWGRRQTNAAFRCSLRLDYADGTSEEIASDGTWKAAYTGKVTHAAIYYGESYDNRVDEGFLTNAVAFADWDVAVPCTEFSGVVAPDPSPGVCRREDLALKPVEAYVWVRASDAQGTNSFGRIVTARTYREGERMMVRRGENLVVDFGQNASAVPDFVFRASRGTVLTARFGEMLNDANGETCRGNDGPAGSVYLANMRSCRSACDYTFAGKGGGRGATALPEHFSPRFSFWGYRYVTISASDDVEILSVRSVPVTSIRTEHERATLETGHAGVNRLLANVRWGLRSNYLSVPTDCPQRDERQGWTADTQVFVRAALYQADVCDFLTKWMDDIADSQCRDGTVPCIAPLSSTCDVAEGLPKLGWSDAVIIVPWQMWTMNGDRAVVDRHWKTMSCYMDRIASDGFVTPTNGYQFADWLSCEKWETCTGAAWDYEKKSYRTEVWDWWNYLGACYLLWDARMMCDMARATERTSEAVRYARLADKTLSRLRRDYLDLSGDLIEKFRDLQTAHLFALKMGLAPTAAAKTAIRDRLVAMIRANGCRIATGFLGTALLMDVLTDEADAADVAYDVLLQHGCPGWLYSVDQGATTIWERWNSYTKEKGFGPVGMNSFNHYAYGSVAAWIYGTAAGIRPDPSRPGFRHFVLAPVPDRRLGFVKARYDSAAGRIVSSWRYEGDRWKWSFTVPPGTTATVRLPDGSPAKEYGPGAYKVAVPGGRF